jgi:hypothetical protein
MLFYLIENLIGINGSYSVNSIDNSAMYCYLIDFYIKFIKLLSFCLLTSNTIILTYFKTKSNTIIIN